MSTIDEKHYEHIAKMNALENEDVMKWYGWGSPVGLTLFFVGVTICAILVRFLFLMK